MMNKEKIEDALLSMGISANIKGFKYITDAVGLYGTKENTSITKFLYPEIARINNTTATKVERGIRHAFNVARSVKGDYEVVEHYIGFINTDNASSIARMYLMLKREG